jgi:hypothetical protein
VLLATIPHVSAQAQEENLTFLGIWSHGDSILLFATVHKCGDELEEPTQPLQTLVSRDEGKTWSRSGPRLLWKKFEFILDTGTEIWIAGDSYDAEGPASTPFILLADPDSRDWQEFEIYQGYDELMAVAKDERDSNRFLAWVNHLMLPPDHPDYGEDDPMFLHESLDRAGTWHVLKKVKTVPKAVPGMRFFEEIPRQSRGWRIINVGQNNSALEHLGKDGKWHQVAKPALPIQESCEE